MRRIYVFGLLAAVAYAQNTNTVTIIPDGGDSVGKIRFLEQRANGSNYIQLQGIGSVSFNKTITLPNLTGRVIVEEADDVTRVTKLQVGTLGTTGSYVRTQKLDLIDVAGGPGIWDWQVSGNMAGNAAAWFRDPLGQDVLRFTRAFAGTLLSDASFSVHLYPSSTVTYDIGASSSRWRTLYVQDINVSGTITGGTSSGACLDCVHLSGSEAIISNDTLGYKTFASGMSVPGRLDFESSKLSYSGDISRWRFAWTQTGQFSLETANDANSAFNYIFRSTRSGTTPSLFTLNSTFLPGGTTFNVGDPTALWEGGFFKHLDAYKSGTTGGYVATQKLDLIDVAGGSGIWDWQAAGNMAGNASAWFRDPLGQDVLRFTRATAGTPLSDATFSVHLYPKTNASYDIGASSFRWRKLWVQDLDISGILTGAPACTDCVHKLGVGGGTAGSELIYSSDSAGVKQFGDQVGDWGVHVDFLAQNAASNQKWWRMAATTSGTFELHAVNDAYSLHNAAFSIERTGEVPTRFSIFEELVTHDVTPRFGSAYSLGTSSDRYATANIDAIHMYADVPLILHGTGFKYMVAESPHMAFYKKEGGQSFYWRKSSTGYPGAPVERTMMELANDGQLSVDGTIYPRVPASFDIGTISSRWSNYYASGGFDAAVPGGAGGYVNAQVFRIFSSNGASNFWDWQGLIDGIGSNSYVTLRDNAGDNVVQFRRRISSALANSAVFYTDVVPGASGLTIGYSTARWGKAYVQGAEVNGDITPASFQTYSVGTATMPFAMVNSVAARINQLDLDIGTRSVAPVAHNTYALGSPSAYWTNVYTSNLGSPTNPIANAYITNCSGCGGMNLASNYDITGQWRFTQLMMKAPDVGSHWYWHVPGATGAGVARLINAGGGISMQVSQSPAQIVLTGNTLPNGSEIYNLGATSSQWATLYVKNINPGSGVSNITMQGNNVDFSGTIQVAGSAIKRSGLTLTIGEAFVPVTGVYSSQYYAGSTAGTTSNLACGSGAAIKTINVSGGIVIGVSCGAP